MMTGDPYTDPDVMALRQVMYRAADDLLAAAAMRRPLTEYAAAYANAFDAWERAEIGAARRGEL